MIRCVRFTVFLLVAGLLMMPGISSAATTGSLLGTVKDSDGKALPGVTVTVTSPALQGSRAATTNVVGEYNLPLLPPGTYRLQYALSGFESVTREGVIVSLDSTTKVNVSLSLSKVVEIVTVKGDTVVIDPTQTNVQQNFKEDHLKYASIGQAGRSYQSVLQQAGGVAGGSNPNVLGGNLGQNVYQIDGLNTTDPVTHTFGLNFGFDAIQEVALQTGGFEAEYGKAVGGLVLVITKSGGNSFSGSFDARYSTEKLTEQGKRKQDFPLGTDALAYDKKTQDFQNLAPQASLGGPILRDQVWFFGNAQRIENKNQPPNTRGFLPGRRDFFGWNLFGKITATPVVNQTAAFKYTNSYGDIPFTQNNSTTRPEAGRDQYQKAQIYNVSYDAVLSSHWLANLQFGLDNTYLISQPHSGDVRTTGKIDRATGISSVNFTNFQKGDRNRTEVIGSTTYYLEALGSHAFKVGTDLEWTAFKNVVNNPTGTPLDSAMCSTQFGQPAGAVCGAIDRPLNGAPSLYDVTTILPSVDFKARGMNFYAQDEWRPVPQVTAKVGVRYDQAAYDKNDGTKGKTLTRFQPRIGVAWDIFNNSSTVFRAQVGEFMDDNALTLPFFLNTLGSVTSRFQWNAAQQRYVFRQAFGGPAGNELDPSLKPTYSQGVNAGITRRIFTNTSLDITGVYRKTKNIYEDTCKDGDCSTSPIYWMTNRPNGLDVLRSEYKGMIFKIESRPTPKMSWLLTYTLSSSKGSIEYTQNQGSDFDVFPDHFTNRFGFLSDDARHRIKLDGFVKLPWEFILGTNIYWDNGTPYNVTSTNAPNAGYGVVFLEPRGSRRLPHFYQWDLQLQKDFLIGPLRVGLIGSAFNVLNTEIATAKDGSVGTGTLANPTNARFNLNTAWQRPRRYEVGFRLEF